MAAIKEMVSRGSEFAPLELSGMLWAIGRMLSVDQRKISSENCNKKDGAHSGVAMSSIDGDGADALELADMVMHVADKELPSKVGSMNDTQLCMALHGLGQISSYSSDFLGSTARQLQQKMPDVQGYRSNSPGKIAVTTLIDAFLECIADDSLSVASFSAALEGISGLLHQGRLANMSSSSSSSSSSSPRQYLLPEHISSSIKSYAINHFSHYNKWEYPSVCFYLTELGLCDVATGLLQQDPPVQLGSITKPRAAALLLASMQRCNVYPRHIVAPVVRCLQHLPSSYMFDAALRGVLCETFGVLGVMEECPKELVVLKGKRKNWMGWKADARGGGGARAHERKIPNR